VLRVMLTMALARAWLTPGSDAGHEGELVVLVGDLDHIAIDGSGLGDVDRFSCWT